MDGMWLIVPLIIGFGFLVHRERKAHAASFSPVKYDAKYTVDYWRPLVQLRMMQEHAATAALPGALEFAMAWLENESDGNPCAYGDPPPDGTAPNGDPKELGLGQIYNPDDVSRIALKVAPMKIKLSSKILRAYCKPGTQTRTRELTPEEMIEQVECTLLVPIDEGISWANQALAKAGLTWSAVDRWKLAKAHHAYPPILNWLVPVSTHGKLLSWADYRAALNKSGGIFAPDATDSSKVTDNNPKGYVNYALHRGFFACELCGNATAQATKGVA
jgi:hypothetical protein